MLMGNWDELLKEGCGFGLLVWFEMYWEVKGLI